MIQNIKDAAKESGISAVFTNSEQKHETQLNSLTREEGAPVMLISWDFDTSLTFDIHGFLENPSVIITALLVGKADTLDKETMEAKSEEMGNLFQVFIQKLYTILVSLQKNLTVPITNATYKNVPNHGAGRHSGVLAKWNMRTQVSNCG